MSKIGFYCEVGVLCDSQKFLKMLGLKEINLTEGGGTNFKSTCTAEELAIIQLETEYKLDKPQKTQL